MLSYTDTGEGVPLIFIHGLGSRKEAWAPQYELANDYRLIAVDLRGHGNSDVQGSITIKNFARDVLEVLEHLKIDRAYFCGLSLGGIVAQEILRQRPSSVKGLIMANTASLIPSFTGRFLETLRGTEEQIVDAILDRSLHNKELEDDARQMFLIREEYESASKAAIGINYLPMLWATRKPILIIGSRNDKTVPMEHQYLTRLNSYTSKLVILNGGHLSNLEQAEEFNCAVRDFINKNEERYNCD